jgi:hypothetical protein
LLDHFLMHPTPLWKFVFTVLVLLPFMPAISVYAAVALAKIKGCGVGEEEICVAGAISVRRTIVETAQISAGLAVVLLAALTWLALCYLSVALGWKRTASRLLVGVAVTVIFGGLPYFASLPAHGNFVEPHCKPYAGGFGGAGCLTAVWRQRAYFADPGVGIFHCAVRFGGLSALCACDLGQALTRVSVWRVVVKDNRKGWITLYRSSSVFETETIAEREAKVSFLGRRGSPNGPDSD